MKKNYFEIKEKKEELHVYQILMCDFIILMNDCVKHHVDLNAFKDYYFYLEEKYDQLYDELKKLEAEKNV